MYIHHMERQAGSTEGGNTLHPQAIAEVCLCQNVRRAARAISRMFDEALAPIGIKSSQFNILIAIAARESSSAAEISSLLAMDRTTLSRNLKPLRTAGYLTCAGGAGRRADSVTLTATGENLLARAAPLWRTAQSGLTQRLGSSIASQLLAGLDAATQASK